MKHILVTGANRGLGLEFTRQYLGRAARVLATCRQPEQAGELHQLMAAHPEQLTILQLDVTKQAEIDAVGEQAAAAVDRLDILINNAGILPRKETPDNITEHTLLKALHTNAVGPLMVAQRLLDLLKAGEQPKIVNITSQIGSLARKSSGGYYSYASSKAALNMLTRALSFDVRREGIIAVMVHPGWVQTDMGGSGASITAEVSVSGLRQVIDDLTMEDSGRFLSWDGNELPW
ncbi:MAG: SDR family oxidoreductase [Anaerolineae bacterium]|nr:SDR family oxidoreductase [Anaerolineae bacterium]